MRNPNSCYLLCKLRLCVTCSMTLVSCEYMLRVGSLGIVPSQGCESLSIEVLLPTWGPLQDHISDFLFLFILISEEPHSKIIQIYH